MAAELEKLADLHPEARDVYQDLARRVRHFKGPEKITRTELPPSPTVREIGKAILDEGPAFCMAGQFVLNAARRFEPGKLFLIQDAITVAKGVTLEPREKAAVLDNGGKRFLTPREYELFFYMASRPDIVLSNRELIRNLWNSATSDDTLRVYIFLLRAKIEEDPKHPKYLVTKHGQGYIFRTNPAEDSHTR